MGAACILKTAVSKTEGSDGIKCYLSPIPSTLYLTRFLTVEIRGGVSNGLKHLCVGPPVFKCSSDYFQDPCSE